MPGSIGQGYLRAEAHYQEQEELAEAKKMQKLTESLRELEMKQLVRGMQREGKEWEYQDRVRREKERALEKLRASGVNLDYLLAGLKEPEEKEQPYPWMGTPYEEVGALKQFDIKPGTDRSLTDAERAERYSKIPEDQRTEYQKKFLKKYFEGTRGATKAISPSGTGISELDESLMESGATFDPASGAFIHVPEGLDKLTLLGQGTGLDALNMGAIGQETGLEGLNIRGIGSQPAGTVTEEDEFIEEARGKKIDWDLVAKDHPTWNIFYIKQKLGVNE